MVGRRLKQERRREERRGGGDGLTSSDFIPSQPRAEGKFLLTPAIVGYAVALRLCSFLFLFLFFWDAGFKSSSSGFVLSIVSTVYLLNWLFYGAPGAASACLLGLRDQLGPHQTTDIASTSHLLSSAQALRYY